MTDTPTLADVLAERMPLCLEARGRLDRYGPDEAQRAWRECSRADWMMYVLSLTGPGAPSRRELAALLDDCIDLVRPDPLELAGLTWAIEHDGVVEFAAHRIEQLVDLAARHARAFVRDYRDNADGLIQAHAHAAACKKARETHHRMATLIRHHYPDPPAWVSRPPATETP